METATCTIVLEPAAEDGYIVPVPALPGSFTQGNSYEEALTMAEDATTLWLGTLVDLPRSEGTA